MERSFFVYLFQFSFVRFFPFSMCSKCSLFVFFYNGRQKKGERGRK